MQPSTKLSISNLSFERFVIQKWVAPILFLFHLEGVNFDFAIHCFGEPILYKTIRMLISFGYATQLVPLSSPDWFFSPSPPIISLDPEMRLFLVSVVLPIACLLYSFSKGVCDFEKLTPHSLSMHLDKTLLSRREWLMSKLFESHASI